MSLGSTSYDLLEEQTKAGSPLLPRPSLRTRTPIQSLQLSWGIGEGAHLICKRGDPFRAKVSHAHL